MISKCTELPKTLQEWFNVAWRHAVVEKNPPSFKMDSGKKICLYRGPNDTCCLIGAGIPDSLYNSEMEGKAVLSVMGTFGIDIKGLRALQSIHDTFCRDSDYPEKIEMYLRNYASQYELEIPEN